MDLCDHSLLVPPLKMEKQVKVSIKLFNKGYLYCIIYHFNTENGNDYIGVVDAPLIFGVGDHRICHSIRASVDALCRDGAGQISRERVQRGRLVQQGTTS